MFPRHSLRHCSEKSHTIDQQLKTTDSYIIVKIYRRAQRAQRKRTEEN